MSLAKWWRKGAEHYLAEANRWLEEAGAVLEVELDGDINATGRYAEHFRRYHAHVVDLAETALALAEHCLAGVDGSEKAARAHRAYLVRRAIVARLEAQARLARAFSRLTIRDYSQPFYGTGLERLAFSITSHGPPSLSASITETASG